MAVLQLRYLVAEPAIVEARLGVAAGSHELLGRPWGLTFLLLFFTSLHTEQKAINALIIHRFHIFFFL